MLELSFNDEFHDLSLSWDSFLTVGVTGGVATELGGGVGWVPSSDEPKLASRGLDHCLGTPLALPNEKERSTLAHAVPNY